MKETVAAKETDFSLRVARKRTGEGDAQTGGNESHSDRRFQIQRLRQELEAVGQRLQHAELVIEVQKKVSELLGIPLSRPLPTGHDS